MRAFFFPHQSSSWRTWQTFLSSCVDLQMIFWKALQKALSTFSTSSLYSWVASRGALLHRLPPTPPCVLTHSLNFSFCSLALFGFRNRMKNPHLRAKFAEVLEAVMPHMEPIAPGAVQPVMFQRERLFCSYRHAPQLAEALITVFVDIEFTGKVFVFKGHIWVFLSFIFLTQDIYFWSSFFFSGDPHQFEQKFNYRRPMYPILKYMWAKDDYRESVKVENPLWFFSNPQNN